MSLKNLSLSLKFKLETQCPKEMNGSNESGLRNEAVNPKGNVSKIDMYDAPREESQSPMDLLLSAVGVGCLCRRRNWMMRNETADDNGFLCRKWIGESK